MNAPEPNQRIHQMQASYDPTEDRLLLRINTNHQEEFRFWLTRRFLKRFWPALGQALKSHPDIALPTAPESRGELLDFMQAKANSKADFSTAYQSNPTVTPLGATPLLVSQARLRAKDAMNFQVSFHPEKGYGIEVVMDAQLLLSFRKLLGDAISQADWDLGVKKAKPKKDPLVPITPPTPPKGPQLH